MNGCIILITATVELGFLVVPKNDRSPSLDTWMPVVILPLSSYPLISTDGIPSLLKMLGLDHWLLAFFLPQHI